MNEVKIPRLRMFAGPNGSGKSTIKQYVSSVISEKLFGFYINPDEIEKKIKKSGFIDFDEFNIQVDKTEAVEFFRSSTLLQKFGRSADCEKLTLNGSRLGFSAIESNPYLASVVSDFIRQKLLETNQTFTFETVMSFEDKVDFLAKAQNAGFRTYLYYVATKDPEINVSRVAYRVKTGGHNVQTDKIVSRYYRSLDLLLDAVKYSNRAYLFDNSGNQAELIAEITDAKRIEIKNDTVPTWFVKYILDKVR